MALFRVKRIIACDWGRARVRVVGNKREASRAKIAPWGKKKQKKTNNNNKAPTCATRRYRNDRSRICTSKASVTNTKKKKCAYHLEIRSLPLLLPQAVCLCRPCAARFSLDEERFSLSLSRARVRRSIAAGFCLPSAPRFFRERDFGEIAASRRSRLCFD